MKKSKKISVLISLVLITLLALGAVSAAEDTAVTDDASVAAIDEVQTVDDAPVTDEINYESNDIIVTDTGDSGDLDDADADVISDTGLKGDSDDGDEAVVSDASSPKNALKAEPLGAPEDDPVGTLTDLWALIENGGTVTLTQNYAYNPSTDTGSYDNSGGWFPTYYYFVNGLRVSNTLTINGNGHYISGGNAVRIFDVDGGTLTLNNVVLKEGNSQYSTLVNNNNRQIYYGGAIYAHGTGVTLNINNCTLTDNHATGGTSQYYSGGAIYSTGTTTILNSILTDNSAYNGGAFTIAGGTFTVHGSVIFDNTASSSTDTFGNNGYRSGGSTNFIDNWWGSNKGPENTLATTTAGTSLSVNDWFILTETLSSPTTVDVDFELYRGGTSQYKIPGRLVTITTDADTCNTTTAYCPDPFVIEFTTSNDAYINASVDHEQQHLKVFAGENKKNITVLRVEVEDVTLPDQPVAHVYSDIDGVYNLTLGTRVIPVTVTNGEGTYQFSGLNVGQYTVIVSRVDDPVYKTTFNTTDFEVKRYATELSIDTETPTTTYGTAVTITHELTPNGPTGFITYYVDGSETGTQLGVNENFVLSGLAAGTHTVVAKYGGDGSYDVSQSEPLTIVVNPATLEFNVTNVTVNYPNKGTVNVTSNVDGIYTVTVNNVDYPVTVGNGKGSFEVDQELQVGEYVISWNIPAGNYTAASGTGFYNVTAPAPEFDITGAVEINYGQTNTITHTITEGATGTITYTINDVTAGTVNVGEDFVTDVLDAGHYVVVAAYSGGGNYGPTSDTFEFDVIPLDVSVTVTSPEVYYPNKGTITLTASAPGTYTVKVGDKTYPVTVETANVAVDVEVEDVFEVGTYEISVTADLGNNYNPVNTGTIGTYTVTKPATSLNIVVSDFVVGSEASATLVLKQGTTALAGKTITVTIDATQKNVTTDSNGEATVDLSALTVGDHFIVALFEGDENYALAFNSTKVTVGNATATLTVAGTEITYGQDATIGISLTGINNEGITGIVKVNVAGEDHNVVVTNGQGTLTISGLAANPDGYTITATFAGNDKYKEATNADEKVKVKKATPSLDVVPLVINYDEAGELTITLDGVNGEKFNAVTVTVTVEGCDDKLVTITNGVGVLDIIGLGAGKYDVTAFYYGNDNYTSAEITKTDAIEVKKLDPTIVLSADATSIKYGETATLSSVVSPNDDDGAVTYYLGETALDTNVLSGLAPGTYTVVAKVAATANYNEATSEALTITVAKADATIELTIDDNELTFGESTTVSSVVSPSDDDGAVTYYVDGTAITGTTVSGLSVGTHTVVAKVAETANYTAAESEAKTITVSKATPEITITSEPVTYPSDAIVNIVLTGANNAALPGATIRVTINGTTYAVTTDNDGKASLTVKGLNVGEYAIAAVSVADNSYNSATYDGSAKVIVNKADATITVSADKTSIKYGESTTVSSVVTPSDDDGAVTYYVDGTAITGTTVSGLSVGEHTVVAKVAATANYNEATSEALTITVEKADATITVSADETNLKYGESTTVSSVVSPSDDDGAVTYYVDGTAITGTTVSGLSVGTHTVVAKVAETNNYNAAESEALTITVAKADASIELTIDDNELTFGESTTVSSVVNPTDDDGAVTYYVDGTAITGTTVSGLSVGTHTVVAKLAETQNYTAAESAAKTITVSKATPEITITTNPVAYPNDAVVNIVLTGANSAALPGATIRVTINGTTYAVTTDNDGKATLNVKGLDAGEYGITAVSVADDSYESATYTGTTKVVVEKSANAKVDVALVGDNIVVSLTGDNNVPLDGTVNVAIDNGEAVAVTITNGQGTLDASALTAGEHTVVATSVADNNYDSATVTKTIEKGSAPKEAVITVTVDDIVYGKDAVVQVTFKDKEGNPLQDTLTVTIGDITKTVTIGEDGTGSVNVAGLNVGHYSAVVSFAGNDTYQATSKDDGFDVSKATTKIESEDIVVTANATETMVFTLKDSNGNLLAGKSITVSFNGQIYDLTTDSNGQIEMQIKMVNQGTYSITASYDGEANYEAATASFNVVVKPIAVKLTVADVTYALSDTKYLTATLTAGDQPLANRIVTFSLNGKTYTGRTNAQGVVRIAVSLTAKKTYSVVASYGGDTTYGSAMAIYKLKVTK